MIVSTIASLMATSLPLAGQSRPDTSLWPSARAGHAMAYHDRLRLVMMYGGRDSVLWGWDGTRWQTFDGPPGGSRMHMRLAYDVRRDRLVMYGGAGGTTRFGDTWEWDGRRWERVTLEGPGLRALHAMSYDPVRQRVVLFGGMGQSTSGTPRWGPMNDTWEWDGTRWTNVSGEGPSARADAGLIFDVRSSRLLLSGGVVFDGTRQILRDTWAWDRGAWRSLGNSEQGVHAPIVQDPATGAPMWVGGKSANVPHGDTWRWTGSTWQAIEGAAAVPMRLTPDMALDVDRKRVVLFGGAPTTGGTAHLADLWEWDGHVWREIKHD